MKTQHDNIVRQPSLGIRWSGRPVRHEVVTEHGRDKVLIVILGLEIGIQWPLAQLQKRYQDLL